MKLRCLTKDHVLNIYLTVCVLHVQVEHLLNDRLLQFVNIDLQDVKVTYAF